ncbi:MAG: hypothetical protein JO255_12640 [Alphaproteobacteria bacterium]|nr:hypothetical protein [Alphaproteobacteria bacterium]
MTQLRISVLKQGTDWLLMYDGLARDLYRSRDTAIAAARRAKEEAALAGVSAELLVQDIGSQLHAMTATEQPATGSAAAAGGKDDRTDPSPAERPDGR